jgi:predicted small lipoprotein YifL
MPALPSRIAIRTLLVFAVVLALLSAGCGFRGPLYLPEDPPADQAEPSATEMTEPDLPNIESEDESDDESEVEGEEVIEEEHDLT